MSDTLQKLFEKVVTEEFSIEGLGTRIVERRLRSLGITLRAEHIRDIRAQFAVAGAADRFTIRFEGEVADRLLEKAADEVSINLSEEVTEEYLEEIENAISAGLPQVISRTSANILKALKRSARSMLAEHMRIERNFQKNLGRVWGKGIDLLKMLQVISYEAGEEFNHEFRAAAVEEGDFMFEVLTRLHAKACQVTNEIIVLLKSGFADGANARWRTLHEIAVTAAFIEEHGNETAERYLAHQIIDSWSSAEQYQKHCKALGLEPFEDSEISKLRAEYNAALAKYGSSFKDRYGWAANILPRDKLSFTGIEQSVGMDHLRPYYKMANLSVHPSSKSLAFCLGLADSEEDILLAGPSNSGLADPGQGAAISLTQVTCSLLCSRPNLDRLVILDVMNHLVNEIENAFVAANNFVEEASRNECNGEASI